MSAIGAIGGYGSMSGYYSIYHNKNGFQNRSANPTGMDPVRPVSRAQTTPVPPVNQVSAVHRGVSQNVPEEESPFSFPTMREGADPAEMAVRARIQYLDDSAEALSPNQAAEGSKSPREVMEESECQTCKNRKYQDGSDEGNVSFKAAAHISPESAASKVRAHENEHVSNAYKKAAKDNGKVVNASVTLQSSICPECGRTYVSGGLTKTAIQYKNEDNPYTKNQKALDAINMRGANVDYAA